MQNEIIVYKTFVALSGLVNIKHTKGLSIRFSMSIFPSQGKLSFLMQHTGDKGPGGLLE